MGNSFMERMMGKPDSAQQTETGREIAVIGIGLRFPLADDPLSFWRNLETNVEAARELPYSRKMEAERYTRVKGMSRDDWQFIRQGYLDRIDCFDYGFFGISPKEAEQMDPHQRLFLETAFHAFEDGGYTTDRLAGSRTGVFVGYDNEAYTYATRVLEVSPRSYKEAHVGNLVSMIPGRVAHTFDLHGPSMIVNTSCSSSLVAVHTAVESIHKGECELALAGGLRLDVWPIDLIGQVGIESALGKTRTFDDRADGTVTGEGVCAVLLKPLQQARRDRDPIYAVIKGSAVNQDGHSIGLTAPNVLSQEQVIVEAWRSAGVAPETMTYIEAHGTGTKLGDPIEIEAIHQAFSRFTSKKQFCAIGSVKPNVGHLIGCAGLAGLVRAVLALQHKTIPATLHYERPNRNIAFEDTAVYVNDTARPWTVPSGVPRRCGVSSFGFSGTNCHVVLEEEPAKVMQTVQSRAADPRILTLSAKSQAALGRRIRQFAAWISESAHGTIDDICYTLHTAREHEDYRLIVVGLDEVDIATRLNGLANRPLDTVMPGAGLVLGAERIADAPLRSLCAAYARGEAVSWEAWYKGRELRRTRLPGYPFERNRCWIQSAAWPTVPLWEPAWDRLDDLAAVLPSGLRRFVVHDGSEASQKVIDKLRACSSSVTTAVLPEGSEDQSWCELLPIADADQAVFLFGLQSAASCAATPIVRVQAGLEKGLFPLLELCRTLANRRGRNPELVIVTSLGYAVTEEEITLVPEHRLLHVMGRSFPLECPNVAIRTLDVDADTNAEAIVQELESPAEKATVAHRGGKRYAIGVRPLQAEPAHELPLREQGVYVLTGGGGAIAQEIAKYLSDQEQRMHLAFVSRFTEPSAHTLHQIRSSGSTVSVHRADVGSLTSLQEALRNIRATYGPIRGVIHCAGIASDSSTLLQKSNDAIRAVLQAKVYGTLYLDMATKEDELDFFLCNSSLAAHIGLAGEIDYSMANAFLDAYCEDRSMRAHGTGCLNWPAWHEQGMAVRAGGDVGSGVLHAVSNSEAMEALDRFLRLGRRAAIVGAPSRGDEAFIRLMAGEIGLHAYMEHAGGKEAATGTAEVRQAAEVAITLAGKEAFSDTERTVAAIWHKVLGYKQYDVEDQFFDIGGNSILILKVHTLLDESYPGAVQLPELFSHPTISKLAAHIDSVWQEDEAEEHAGVDIPEGTASEQQEDGELDELIQQLSSGNVTVEHAMSLLQKDRTGDAS